MSREKDGCEQFSFRYFAAKKYGRVVLRITGDCKPRRRVTGDKTLRDEVRDGHSGVVCRRLMELSNIATDSQR